MAKTGALVPHLVKAYLFNISLHYLYSLNQNAFEEKAWVSYYSERKSQFLIKAAPYRTSSKEDMSKTRLKLTGRAKATNCCPVSICCKELRSLVNGELM